MTDDDGAVATHQLPGLSVQEQPLQPEEREREDCKAAWGRHLYDMRVVLDKTEGEEETCDDADECEPAAIIDKTLF